MAALGMMLTMELANARIERLRSPKLFYGYVAVCTAISLFILRRFAIKALVGYFRFISAAIVVGLVFLIGNFVKCRLRSMLPRSRMVPVSDFHVVITGSCQGIGLGLAREFLGRGCYVTISGRRPDAVEKALNTLRSEFDKAHVFGCCCDVTNYDQCVALWRSAAANMATSPRGAHIDMWINNAGMGNDSLPFWEVPESQIRDIVMSNIVGTMFCCKAALPEMQKQGYGQIYNFEGFGSAGAVMKDRSVYATTKNAITYFSRTLRCDLDAYGTANKRVHNIQIGTIQPGMVWTHLLLKGLPFMPPAERARAEMVFGSVGQPVEKACRNAVDEVMENAMPTGPLPAGSPPQRFDIAAQGAKSAVQTMLGFMRAGLGRRVTLPNADELRN